MSNPPKTLYCDNGGHALRPGTTRGPLHRLDNGRTVCHACYTVGGLIAAPQAPCPELAMLRGAMGTNSTTGQPVVPECEPGELTLTGYRCRHCNTTTTNPPRPAPDERRPWAGLVGFSEVGVIL